ncbi:hypothetical protein EI42_01510 [Thermosporothrix hazakensis]|uniref:Uncharacterized protein n=2 Tax=Thermosporothrix TaxID=768650 RepID=A0A326UC70_THEHA|nr:hypothetical protein [Thermosporothrix hazakensis]PZW32965.1 hypothetical protein EI42_01510 [Thermosporothrix hazakensis]BBH90947.1 hypothetical protein KTC_56980 [Thermosporothrix sp. COM3]GCE48997.1 hypothetical protein KTH_38660 [Thermosporothrix hazakensis]
MEKAKRKRTSLMAILGDLNRPLRVRPVRYMGREWWAIDPEDIWPGMVMDLRRLGFEAMAMGDEVLVRESMPALEAPVDGSMYPGGLKPFPSVHPTIRIRKDAYSTRYSGLSYLDEEEDELEPTDLSYDDLLPDEEEDIELSEQEYRA